jgi:hypothetical protein
MHIEYLLSCDDHIPVTYDLMITILNVCVYEREATSLFFNADYWQIKFRSFDYHVFIPAEKGKRKNSHKNIYFLNFPATSTTPTSAISARKLPNPGVSSVFVTWIGSAELTYNADSSST